MNWIPIKGKVFWNSDNTTYGYYCSNCKGKIRNQDAKKFAYCPYCGERRNDELDNRQRA